MDSSLYYFMFAADTKWVIKGLYSKKKLYTFLMKEKECNSLHQMRKLGYRDFCLDFKKKSGFKEQNYKGRLFMHD